MKQERVPLGCRPLDELLGGGVECGTVTLLYSREVARRGLKVVYIDTEGVSIERLAQICGGDFDKIAPCILFFEPDTLEEQRDAIEKSQRILEGEAPVGLLVLDSATTHYRVLFGTEGEESGRTSLVAQITRLLVIARRRRLPIVITTQVYTDSARNTFEPIGGHAFLHTAKAVLRLEKSDGPRRRATLMKHRSLREGQSAYFTIGPEGLE